MTTASIKKFCGVDCLVPNTIFAIKDDVNSYISYNNYDSNVYGCDTTAICIYIDPKKLPTVDTKERLKIGVFQGHNHYVLNGDHRENLKNLNIEECIRYIINNSDKKNKYSQDIDLFLKWQKGDKMKTFKLSLLTNPLKKHIKFTKDIMSKYPKDSLSIDHFAYSGSTKDTRFAYISIYAYGTEYTNDCNLVIRIIYNEYIKVEHRQKGFDITDKQLKQLAIEYRDQYKKVKEWK